MSDLAVSDLTVEYSSGGYAARPVDGFTLDIPSGQLVLLRGASGCGKTTVLSVLAGILTPAAGAVRFGEGDVTAPKGQALTHYPRPTVGVVFQAFNPVPNLTASEDV